MTHTPHTQVEHKTDCPMYLLKPEFMLNTLDVSKLHCTCPTPTQEKVWEGWCIFSKERPLSFHPTKREAKETLDHLFVMYKGNQIVARKVTITSV